MNRSARPDPATPAGRSAGNPGAGARLEALDVFRGATVAGMIVVNTPGDWNHVFAPLLHAEWHGWTPTDTIFPFFLFIVGVSIALSFGRRRTAGSRRSLVLHTLKRAAVIFFLGLALNVLSFFLFHRRSVRIPGVLQRIGVCFFFAAAIYLLVGPRGLLPAAAVLLAVYWALLTFVPVPGGNTGRLDLEGNLASWVDRAVLGDHTWKHDPGWDPEGPLSTIPAIATTLLGIAAGELLRAARPAAWKLAALMAGGALALSLGLLWGVAFPINKNLWTSSYALFMPGLAAVVLALCIWLVDVRGWRGWGRPFVWLGRNAIAIFVLSTLATIPSLAIKIAGDGGKPRSLYGTAYQVVFRRFADERVGSLLFALAVLGVWLAVAYGLHRRRIFIKV
ncbi:MAG: heparan-alpha-glucosaminide N-acetyltransferase domain-containing protein [Acidobacteriota bacterium]